MTDERKSMLDALGERLAVAFVSTVLAAITLFLYPLALSFIVSMRKPARLMPPFPAIPPCAVSLHVTWRGTR